MCLNISLHRRAKTDRLKYVTQWKIRRTLKLLKKTFSTIPCFRSSGTSFVAEAVGQSCKQRRNYKSQSLTYKHTTAGSPSVSCGVESMGTVNYRLYPTAVREWKGGKHAPCTPSCALKCLCACVCLCYVL